DLATISDTCGPDFVLQQSSDWPAQPTPRGSHSGEEVIGQPHAKYQHGYTVVRIDLPVSESNPENSLAVVKVFSSKVSAEEETARLNKVNAEKRCKYVVLV